MEVLNLLVLLKDRKEEVNYQVQSILNMQNQVSLSV